MNKKQKPFAIGGVEATELVETYGAPLYVYDTAIMERQYKRLTQAFASQKIKVNYACKALNNINVLKFFKSL